MDMSVYHALETMGFIPVVEIAHKVHAVPLAHALRAGELPCVEITMRTESALDSIKEVRRHCPDVLVGAGTVHTAEQAAQVIDAGAQFVVSPSFDRKMINYCIDHDVAVIPNVGTSHLNELLEIGLPLAKFFPAESLGGIATMAHFAQLYPFSFMPTGGVSVEQIGTYIRSPSVSCVGGSCVAPRTLISEQGFDEITRRTKQVIKELLGVSLAHVGINGDGEKDAKNIADELSLLLGDTTREVPGASFFVGSEYEIMWNGTGTHGHLGIATNSMAVAMRVFKARGYAFNEDLIRYDDQGRLYLAYFAHEIAGFTHHLVQKK